TNNADWLIARLEEGKKEFIDETFPPNSGQLRSFALYLALFKESQQSLMKRSKQRRSVRLRARDILVDIFFGIGKDLFLLCIFKVPISKLGTLKQRSLVVKLSDWWSHTTHP
ncbi:hypothetical protein BS50DRAFT_450900, partial [Corynespora cassiicola Philippines]